MKTHKRIADLVIQLTNTDIFSQRKTQDIVDARSLYDYVMHKRLEFTLASICNYYRERGKGRHHSTVIYSCKLFDEVVFRRPEFSEYEAKIVGTELTKVQYQNAYELVGKLNTKKQLKKFRRIMNEIIADANV